MRIGAHTRAHGCVEALRDGFYLGVQRAFEASPKLGIEASAHRRRVLEVKDGARGSNVSS
ncbi:hypothetical protein MOX01_23270 [Microbacterium oxydans]|nr:hypothetical protein MOX01_23270 [Microbacterium oxydans]